MMFSQNFFIEFEGEISLDFSFFIWSTRFQYSSFFVTQVDVFRGERFCYFWVVGSDEGVVRICIFFEFLVLVVVLQERIEFGYVVLLLLDGNISLRVILILSFNKSFWVAVSFLLCLIYMQDMDWFILFLIIFGVGQRWGVDVFIFKMELMRFRQGR